MTAATACSRLSPHLAFGTLSMRHAWQASEARRLEVTAAVATTTTAGKRQTLRAWQRSLRAMQSRFQWHCHFMQKLEDAPAIEFQNMLRAADGLREGEIDADRLAAWLGGISFLHRFGSAFNRHVHLHACVTDRVFVPPADKAVSDAPPALIAARPITPADLAALTERVRPQATLRTARCRRPHNQSPLRAAMAQGRQLGRAGSWAEVHPARGQCRAAGASARLTGPGTTHRLGRACPGS